MSQSQVVQLRKRRPSGPHSITSYLGYVACPRRQRLQNEAQDGCTNMDIGTVLHVYLEAYFGGKDWRLTQFEPEPSPFVLHEAERVMSAFTYARGRKCFGEVLALEQHISGPAVEAAIGAKPFSATIDMVVRLSQDNCDALAESDRLDVIPGVYIVDHKSSEKGGAAFLERQQMNLQYMAYQIAWNAARPDAPAIGAFCNGLIMTKVPYFPLVQIKAPEATDYAALRNLFAVAAMYAKHMPDAAIPTSCLTYGVCEQYVQGRCSRY